MTEALSREVEIDPRHTALLIVDVQNYTARRDGGEYRGLTEPEIEERFGYFFRTFAATTLPNLQRLQAACRNGGIEVLYTVIESLTRDASPATGATAASITRSAACTRRKARGTHRCSRRSGRAKTKSSSRRHHRRPSSRRISITSCAISACVR
jgi:nicotinamidase-related amidase